MAHQNPNSFIDGVPVKISEKYKPPPKISLPQKIVQCLAHCQAASIARDLGYDFQLEQNSRHTISSWKNQRQQDRFARKERFRQRQIERQRQHDDHQKQMLTAVSYPSAADFPSDEDDQEPLSKSSEVATKQQEGIHSEPASTHSTAESTAKSTPVLDVQQRFDTILMPTIVPGPAKPNYSWSFANKVLATDEATNNSYTDIASMYSTSAPSAINKINWSDFENDTSSPFDNVELKSINDLDILAQVLRQNYISTPSEKKEEPAAESNGQQNKTVIDSETSTHSVMHPINANFLNSNGVSGPPNNVNHSTGYYQPDANMYTANNYYYHNTPLHQQPPITYNQQTQNHHLYFNYQNQALSVAARGADSNPGCNQRYAAAYGAEVPLNASAAWPVPHADHSSSPTPKASSVPDILRQLKNNTDN